MEAFQIVAVLSVDPAITNSLSGDQARSYTCLVVTLRTSQLIAQIWPSLIDEAAKKISLLEHLLSSPMLFIRNFIRRFPKCARGFLGWNPDDDISICTSVHALLLLDQPEHITIGQVRTYVQSSSDYMRMWKFGKGLVKQRSMGV